MEFSYLFLKYNRFIILSMYFIDNIRQNSYNFYNIRYIVSNVNGVNIVFRREKHEESKHIGADTGYGNSGRCL